MENEPEQKPTLHLVNPRTMTAESLDQLYERLTGKKVTAEEHAESVRLVENLKARRAARENAED